LDQAELLHDAEVVSDRPMLHDLVTHDAVEVDALDGELPACRRDAYEQAAEDRQFGRA